MSVSPLMGRMNKGSRYKIVSIFISWTGRFFLFVLKKPQIQLSYLLRSCSQTVTRAFSARLSRMCKEKKAQCDLITKRLEKMIFSLHQTLLDFTWPFSTHQINMSEQRNQSMHKTLSIIVLKEGNAEEKAFSMSGQVLGHKEHTVKAKPHVEGQCPSQI